MKKDIQFIEAPKKQYNKKPTTHIKVIGDKEKTNMKKSNDYKKAKSIHKAEIKQLKRDIRTHKLLIKQAKISYQLTK